MLLQDTVVLKVCSSLLTIIRGFQDVEEVVHKRGNDLHYVWERSGEVEGSRKVKENSGKRSWLYSINLIKMSPYKTKVFSDMGERFFFFWHKKTNDVTTAWLIPVVHLLSLGLSIGQVFFVALLWQNQMTLIVSTVRISTICTLKGETLIVLYSFEHRWWIALSYLRNGKPGWRAHFNGLVWFILKSFCFTILTNSFFIFFFSFLLTVSAAFFYPRLVPLPQSVVPEHTHVVLVIFALKPFQER